MSVKMSIEYQGELRCTLTHGPSGTAIATDAPTDNGGQGSAFSPTDLMGAALLSCAVTTMAIVGAREGIPFTTASGSVEKHMLSDPRRVGRLVLAIDLPASLPAAQRTRLEAIARGCPVAKSVAHELVVEMTFRYA